MAGNSTSPYQIRSYSEITPYKAITFRYNYHPRPEYSSKPQFIINLKISGKSRFVLCVMNEDSTQLGSTDITLPEIRIRFNLEQFMCQGKAREAIGEKLRNWPVELDHEKLIETVLSRTLRGVISMPAIHNVVSLHFRVDMVQEHYFDERRLVTWSMDRAIRDSMEEEEVRMVPADESSIENLMERKSRSCGNNDGDCAVCMDEFSRDCEVVCMPCLHYFHGECIKNWLRTSHYCPICRFEMPTGDRV